MRPDPRARSPRARFRRIRSGERGFTLLEVVVAFAIAALGLSVLFSGTLGGLRAAEVAGRYGEAVSRARSHLAAVGHGAPLAAGEQGGEDDGGWRWRLRIAPMAGVARAQGNPVPTLFAVSVSVSWGEGDAERRVQLDTRRLGSAPPAGP